MDKIPCPLCRKHRELIYFKRLREHLDRHAESPEIIALPNVYICGCCAANIGYSLGWILVGFMKKETEQAYAKWETIADLLNEIQIESLLAEGAVAFIVI